MYMNSYFIEFNVNLKHSVLTYDTRNNPLIARVVKLPLSDFQAIKH